MDKRKNRKKAGMDLCRFVNSRDIREHLREMNYEFNSKEAVWLVYHSREATVKERLEACRYITGEMMDTPLGHTEHYSGKYKMAHQLARDYSVILEHFLEMLSETDDRAFYSYRIEGVRGDWEEYAIPYSSFQKCIETLKEEAGESVFSGYYVTKRWIDHEKQSLVFVFDRNDELVDVEYPEEYNDDELKECFRELGIHLPTPFKKGDILVMYDHGDPERMTEYVVVEEMPVWSDRSDNPDMIIKGCAYCEGFLIDDHTMMPYTEYERYLGLNGDAEILEWISNHIKGEISLEKLLNAYRKILFKEAADERRRTGIRMKTGRLSLVEIQEAEAEELRRKLPFLHIQF